MKTLSTEIIKIVAVVAVLTMIHQTEAFRNLANADQAFAADQVTVAAETPTYYYLCRVAASVVSPIGC